MEIRLQVFHGANIHVPFAAVMLEFIDHYHDQLSAAAVESQWLKIDSKRLWRDAAADGTCSFSRLVATLAIKLQHPDDPENADIRIIAGAVGKPDVIVMRFVEPAATLRVLRSAVFLAEQVFHGCKGGSFNVESLTHHFRQVQANLHNVLPQTPIVRTLIREARRRRIPVYPVAESSRIWLFGQGAAGTHFLEAANERDSFSGMHLQQDKRWSNLLIRRLGFPGVTHGVALHAEDAIEIAIKLGYPIVVKPISSGKGQGVSAFVTDTAELETAFAKAKGFSSRGVIVERHVLGNDHRLAVFGGRFVWAAARYPARVTGDGSCSIAELIERENCRRAACPVAAKDGLIAIRPDEDMVLHLHKQGLTLDSRLPMAMTVNLRSVANLSKGGDIQDISDAVHPDNIAMAEAIARSFRMDTLGVDFMTPDISRSWREVECAVIEVNGMPGIFFDERVQKVLLAKFPAGSDGRIPSVLLIDPPNGAITSVSDWFSAQELVAGQVTADYTRLGKHERSLPDTELSSRVLALIADPGCHALVIEAVSAQLIREGLPLEQFDLVLAFRTMTPELRQLVQSCASRVVDVSRESPAFAELLNDMIQSYTARFG